jgi:hypothetical protein
MWISLFTVVLAIALGFGVSAVALESYGEEVGLYRHRPGRHLRATARYLRASARM